MTTKLYVGNLSYDTSEDDLRQLFSKAGEVASITLITDRDSGRPKGFGFIEMASQADADKAVSMFNGATLHDRQIKVDEARPREERRGGGGGRGGYGGRGGGRGDYGGRGGGRGGGYSDRGGRDRRSRY